MANTKKSSKPARSACCGVPLNIPYQPTGCPHCNPIFWGAIGPSLYAAGSLAVRQQRNASVTF